MGCASSIANPGEKSTTAPPKVDPRHYHSRETRIVQEEEVDVYIDDEYDQVDNDWMYYSGNYQLIELQSEWREGATAGGSRNDLELFSMNPQFLLSIGVKEKHFQADAYSNWNNEVNHHNKMQVSVCLEQAGQKPLAHVAYFIYRSDRDERLSAEYFLVVPPEADTGAFVNWRQVRHEFRLAPGFYMIVPATFLPNISRKFSLTVQTFPPFSLKEV